MGLGKTLQVIALLWTLLKQGSQVIKSNLPFLHCFHFQPYSRPAAHTTYVERVPSSVPMMP